LTNFWSGNAPTKSWRNELVCFGRLRSAGPVQDESGADKVAAAIIAANNGEAEIVMNRINLLEVYYDVYRFRGEEQAKVMLVNLKKHRIEINAKITDELFAVAGRL
jgi:hypothetical protein